MTNNEDKAHDASVSLTAAAVVSPKRPQDQTVLAAFVRELQGRKVRVGGLLQDMKLDKTGRPITLFSEDIETGQRISLKRPEEEIKGPSDCVLELSALSETSESLRRAVREKADLIVIEKFGKEEAAGRGLVDEIMAAIASDIPVLVLLPEAYVEEWSQFTGGIVGTIDLNADVLHQWWGQITEHE